MIKTKVAVVRFPASVLNPIGDFLQARLRLLQKRKRSVENEDPFKDEDRLLDNASPDADAAEQFGHARTTALGQEINRKIIQTRKALTRIKIGKYAICENCGAMIDTDRLMIYPEATLCINCEITKEKKSKNK